MGKTAVLVADTTLVGCYSGQTDEKGRITWTDLPEDVEMSRGDMVLVLKEEQGVAQVYVPTGDSPMGLYGALSAAALSQKAEDLAEKGTLANAQGRTAYAGADGTGPEKMSGLVRILERGEKLYQVQPFSGGDQRTFWIDKGELSFQLDAIIVARKG